MKKEYTIKNKLKIEDQKKNYNNNRLIKIDNLRLRISKHL